jgi:hypothetical protein
LEDKLTGLQEGRSLSSVYETTFLIKWPEALGGETITVPFYGAMTMVPSMGS